MEGYNSDCRIDFKSWLMDINPDRGFSFGTLGVSLGIPRIHSLHRVYYRGLLQVTSDLCEKLLRKKEDIAEFALAIYTAHSTRVLYHKVLNLKQAESAYYSSALTAVCLHSKEFPYLLLHVVLF